MSAATDHWVERRAMSLADFESLPAEVRAEYLDGVAIMSPPADIAHQALAVRIAVLLSRALPDLVVVAEAGLRTVRDGRRIPDVMVLRHEEDAVWARQRAVVAVEITSPSTRAEDTLRKPAEYAQAGVGQYWLVDREQRTLVVRENVDGEPTVVLELDEQHPTGEVRVGAYGVVPLDLRELLRVRRS